MSKKFKEIIGVIGFVALFAAVVYMKTMRKIDRRKAPKKENAEKGRQIMENVKEQEKKNYELTIQKEQQKRDSLKQLQRDKKKEQLKKTQELIKKLDKEIEEKKIKSTINIKIL